MRAALFCLFGGLTSLASAQESPGSLPSSQPASQSASSPLDDAANALGPTSTPDSSPLHFPTLEPPRLTPPTIPIRSNPGTAAALAIIPGAGHFYLGDYQEGGAYLGTEFVFVSLLFTVSELDLSGVVAGSLTQNLLFYNIFDAYRDARVKRSDIDYKYPITREPLGQLANAPFRASALKSPWVWAGVPAALLGGLGVSLLAEEFFPSAKLSPMSLRPTPLLRTKLSAVIDSEDTATIVAGSAFFAATFVPVGVGEEALFRGVFQAGLTEQFGPIRGWLAASLLFGAVHIPNFIERDPVTLQATGFNEAGYLAVPYITLVGAGLGYAYMKDGYKLETSVAAHFWYDFLLSVGSLFALANDETAMFQFSFPL